MAANITGDLSIDTSDYKAMVHDGKKWVHMDSMPGNIKDTRDEFEYAREQKFKEHPELKKAWEEYKFVEKLTL